MHSNLLSERTNLVLAEQNAEIFFQCRLCMADLVGIQPSGWRIISTDSTSAAVKQPLRNKPIMLWKKLNNLSASLKHQRVLVSNKSFVKFQLQHQSCNLLWEGQSCYCRARRMAGTMISAEGSDNTILVIMILSASLASSAGGGTKQVSMFL